jgi:hypothetical protein
MLRESLVGIGTKKTFSVKNLSNQIIGAEAASAQRAPDYRSGCIKNKYSLSLSVF